MENKGRAPAMAAELVIAPEAALDITEAYISYENRRAGLGEEFLSAVDASMERIRRQPRDLRSRLRGVPARLDPAISIPHLLRVRGNGRDSLRRVSTSRDPEKWRLRLP
jgi:hypothetical protein